MDFIEMQVIIESHYKAQYEPYHSELIRKYIDSEKIPYDVALNEILKSHPVNFGLPDYAAVNKALSEKTGNRIQIEAEKAWNDVKRKVSYTHSIVFEDPRACYAFEQIGGIDGYCNGQVKYLELQKKNFVEAFARAHRMQLSTIRTFHGSLDDSDKRTVYVGNKDRIMIELAKNPSEFVSVANKLQVSYNRQELEEMHDKAENDFF